MYMKTHSGQLLDVPEGESYGIKIEFYRTLEKMAETLGTHEDECYYSPIVIHESVITKELELAEVKTREEELAEQKRLNAKYPGPPDPKHEAEPQQLG